MGVICKIWKTIPMLLGGLLGYLVAEFRPSFPLLTIAVLFILYDAWTAYKLDKRVHKAFPDKVSRKEAKFTSFAFGKVIKQTIPNRLWVIILAFCAEHWVFIHVTIPLSYIVTGAILFEQAWSILENESSCRTDDDSRLWKALQRIMIDKTERHFDVKLEGLKKDGGITNEQVKSAIKRLSEFVRTKDSQDNEDTNR